MGWRIAGYQRPVPLNALTMRDGTAMQLAGVNKARTPVHNGHITEVLGGLLAPAPGRQRLVLFSSYTTSVWHVRRELQLLQHKELLCLAACC